MSHSKPDVIIITGGGRGIGAATARLAASRGYAVCINYANQDAPAMALVEEITKNGGTAIAVKADVSDANDVKKLFDETTNAFGTPTLLVNCAGNTPNREALTAMDVATIQNTQNINSMGTILCAREAVQRMTAAGRGGAIVNVSSLVAVTGGFFLAAYAASKGAVESFTISLAREVGELNIRINCVRPGIISTDQQPMNDVEWVKRTTETIPLRRIGTSEEVAFAILWLLSEESAYTTGVILPISGGR